MPRYLIITTGIAFIIFMLFMWGYLFLYGAPKQTSEVFSNLKVITQDDGSIRTIETAPQQEGTRLSLGDRPLEQLTTRAVAGFMHLGEDDALIRYVERGTGHIYEIDLKNSFETQVSLTTLPQTVEATFSPLGTHVALTVFEGYARVVSVGALDIQNKSLEFIKLPQGADNLAFKNEGEIFFSLSNDAETVGYSLNLSSQIQKEIFRAPFADATALWEGETPTITQKPSRFFDGAMYGVNGKTLTPKTPALRGFSGFAFGSYTIATALENDVFVSSALLGAQTYPQGSLLLKEKCAHGASTGQTLWCAAPLTTSSTYLEDWYKGIHISEDYIWKSDLPTGGAILVGDLAELSGQTLDVVNLEMNDGETKLFFTNKRDQTLWAYTVPKE